MNSPVEPDKVMKDSCNFVRENGLKTNSSAVRKCQGCTQWFYWNDDDTQPRHCNDCVKELGE